MFHVATKVMQACTRAQLSTTMLRATLNLPTGRLGPACAMPIRSSSTGGNNLTQLYAFARRHLRVGKQPSPAVISGLSELTARVELEELGFSAECLSDPQTFLRQAAAADPTGSHPFLCGEAAYMHLYEDEHFSMGVFLLPPGGCIPLHNHPGMHVVSRLMWGSLRVRAFDLVKRLEPGEAVAAVVAAANGSSTQGTAPTGARAQRSRSSGGGSKGRMANVPLTAALRLAVPTWRATMTIDTTLNAPVTPMVVMPSSGNVHEFHAAGPGGCAILDLLTPPYESMDGRDCTYYTQLPGPEGSSVVGGTVLLQEDPTCDFGVEHIPYLGVQLPA